MMKLKTVSSLDKKLSHPNYRRSEEFQNAQEQDILQQKEDEEVTRTWKRQPLQGFNVWITLYYKKKVFDDIRSVLTAVGGEKILKQFMDGCFGHLMHFSGGSSCNRALHELMSREISLVGAREDELWFHISGTNIRFAPAEYTLVTGLHFGSFSFASLGSMPPDGVYKRFCGGCSITVKELWERFNSQRVRGSAEDYLKVAHILALYLMVLGYYEMRTVDEWVWDLVEDLDSWNEFPWGAYSYQALMHYVSILPKTTVDLGHRYHVVLGHRYHFPGPVWALQIWAYEAIPDLGKKCAKLVTREVSMPRCLKWSFPNTRFNDLAPFFKQELVCSVTLEPTYEERLQPYWLSVWTPRPLGVRYAPPIVGQRQGAARHLSRRRHRRKRARASTRSASSSSGEHGRQQHVPKWPQVFDEAGFADRVSGRVVDRLIEPVADRVMQKLIESGSVIVTQRSIKPVVERLSHQLAPQMKQWMEDLFRGSRHSSSQQSPPRPPPPPLVHDQPPREVHDDHVKTTNKKKMKKNDTSKHTRRSPSSNGGMSGEEGSQSSSSSGEERRRKIRKRGKKKKQRYSESNLSESSESDGHRRSRNRRKRRRSSSPDASDSDARGSKRRPRRRRQQQQHDSVSSPD